MVFTFALKAFYIFPGMRPHLMPSKEKTGLSSSPLGLCLAVGGLAMGSNGALTKSLALATLAQATFLPSELLKVAQNLTLIFSSAIVLNNFNFVGSLGCSFRSTSPSIS